MQESNQSTLLASWVHCQKCRFLIQLTEGVEGNDFGIFIVVSCTQAVQLRDVKPARDAAGPPIFVHRLDLVRWVGVECHFHKLTHMSPLVQFLPSDVHCGQ